MDNIRDLVTGWDNVKSMEELILDKKGMYDDHLVEGLIYLFNKYNPQVLVNPMKGNLAAGLNLDEGFVPISMSNTFDKLCTDSKGHFDVIDYLVYVLYEALQKTKDEKMLNTTVCRSLRSFPSYLRELDLKTQLESAMKDVKFDHSVDLDQKSHADLYFKIGDREYFLWSYTDTLNARRNLLEKFTEKRGKLPKGIHVLAPFSLWSCDTISEWKFYNTDFIKDLTNKLNSDTIDVSYGEFCKDLDEPKFRKITLIRK